MEEIDELVYKIQDLKANHKVYCNNINEYKKHITWHKSAINDDWWM
jgi:peptidoglycan hydrolase CwlO-like protein